MAVASLPRKTSQHRKPKPVSEAVPTTLVASVLAALSGKTVSGFDGDITLIPVPTVIMEVVCYHVGRWMKDLTGVEVDEAETLDRDYRPTSERDVFEPGEYMLRFCNSSNVDTHIYVGWDGEAITGAWLDWKDCGENLLHLSANNT